MNQHRYHLNNIEKPGRYIGGEVGAAVKKDEDIRLHVALAFPDVYEIGMSHVGLKILYGMINQNPVFWAERVMAPWFDKEEELVRTGTPLTSLESGRPLADFDLVGFSLQYELCYTNVLNMLNLAGIPLLSREREESHPLIVGGGPIAYNPEPLADYFDFFYLGDAEAGFLEILAEIDEWKTAGGSKRELLEHLAGRPGVYIPSFFEPIYESGRLVDITPLKPGYEQVRRAVVPDLNTAYFSDCPVVPFTQPVHDRVAIEIGRGCTRGCRFCQAGYIYRPVRERNTSKILDLAAKALASTGQDEASFLSLAAGDYSNLINLMTAFMDVHGPNHIALALPSLRVKSLNQEIMKQIKRVRKTGFTLAPEAGTQRLRDVINKDLTEDDLLFAAREAFHMGWRLIKLYFMVGLPTETEEDVAAIADLAARVQSGTRSKVNVSFAVFVPKPHTPFQWEPMLDRDSMQQRMELLRDSLRKPGLRPKWNPVQASLLEGVLSRGDRRLGPVIREVHSRGGRFDAWRERFDLERWLDAMAGFNLDPGQYLGARSGDEVLAWQHLTTGATRDYLWSEREKAYQGTTTPDCRDGQCGACGVCDFKDIKPVTAPDESPGVQPLADSDNEIIRWRVNYEKSGQARFLSHLETVDVFLRAFRRAGFRFKMSQGFHPQPKIMFATPIPVGLTSRDEYFRVDLIDPIPPQLALDRLNETLPAGFRIKEITPMPMEGWRLKALGAIYQLEAEEPIFDQNKLKDKLSLDEITITKPSKKGERILDLKKMMGDVMVLTASQIELTLWLRPEGSIRPLQAAGTLFGLSEEHLKGIHIIKTRTLLS